MIKKRYMILLGILLTGSMLMSGCGDGTPEAKNGDSVKVHYTGKLTDGTEFDSSLGSEPFEFIIGGNQVIPGFEKAVIGLKVGESNKVTIPADEAYGQHLDDLIMVIDRSQFPEGLEPEVGQQLQATEESGQIITVTVVDFSESTVTLDANHRLAGKDLVFEVELVEIVE